MQKNLLIVFAKNKLYGKVKTRLAKSIGDEKAFQVYERLFHITEEESCKVKNADVEVHYSHEIDAEAWVDCLKYVQYGADLGERMGNAFAKAYENGYTNVIGIGADLPEINSTLIESAFKALKDSDFVFGPALDGGYYLVGMNKPEGMYIFEDKPWSTEKLFEITRAEIAKNQHNITTLPTLNDIDTIDDLEKSVLGNEYKAVIAKARM